jgi:hypothetical protein
MTAVAVSFYSPPPCHSVTTIVQKYKQDRDTWPHSQKTLREERTSRPLPSRRLDPFRRRHRRSLVIVTASKREKLLIIAFLQLLPSVVYLKKLSILLPLNCCKMAVPLFLKVSCDFEKETFKNRFSREWRLKY